MRNKFIAVLLIFTIIIGGIISKPKEAEAALPLVLTPKIISVVGSLLVAGGIIFSNKDAIKGTVTDFLYQHSTLNLINRIKDFGVGNTLIVTSDIATALNTYVNGRINDSINNPTEVIEYTTGSELISSPINVELQQGATALKVVDNGIDLQSLHLAQIIFTSAKQGQAFVDVDVQMNSGVTNITQAARRISEKMTFECGVPYVIVAMHNPPNTTPILRNGIYTSDMTRLEYITGTSQIWDTEEAFLSLRHLTSGLSSAISVQVIPYGYTGVQNGEAVLGNNISLDQNVIENDLTDAGVVIVDETALLNATAPQVIVNNPEAVIQTGLLEGIKTGILEGFTGLVETITALPMTITSHLDTNFFQKINPKIPNISPLLSALIALLMAIIYYIARVLAFILTLYDVQPTTALFNDNVILGINWIQNQQLPNGITIIAFITAVISLIAGLLFWKVFKKLARGV